MGWRANEKLMLGRMRARAERPRGSHSLYGVELETGKLFGKKVPLCSMEPGPKTNPQQCPWSIELA